jgi:hypothetical protein
MENEGANRLELRAPLRYVRDLSPVPWGSGGDPGKYRERLFCFAIDETQAQSIEPDPAAFLGPLIAGGYEAAARSAEGQETIELPQGHYLFAQERRAWSSGPPPSFERDEVVLMAIEVQKDGLWERLTLEGRLYLRYLYEDGAMVAQVFRPYDEKR